MLRIVDRRDELVTVEASGRVTRDDFKDVVPQLEGAISTHGKLRMLLRLDHVSRWQPDALLEDAKFDLKHRNHFARIAVVGHGITERIATRLAGSVVKGPVRFFERSEAAMAESWVRERDTHRGGYA